MNINNIKNNSAIMILKKVWRVIRIPLLIIIILFIGLMIYRFPVVEERIKTQEVVKVIQAQKLTMADVVGQNLPPEPDAALNNASLEGVDANNNGIRDDVELAIFKLHPDSARIRAAELQYAMALQNEMNGNVFNSDSLVAVMQQESRGFFCISDVTRVTNDYDLVVQRKKEIDDLILNTLSRKNKVEDIYKNYMTSYKITDGPHCDIDLTTLSN
jgi:uncharacterized protein YqfB (UPF0267 family)